MLIPKVSALMVTGKCEARRPLARLAIECFEHQIWPNKELIIVNHGGRKVGNLSANIHEYLVDCDSSKVILGDLRNLSVRLAHGDWCVVWDDDDWFHPSLISSLMQEATEWTPTVLRNELRLCLQTGAVYYSSLPGGQKHPCFFKKNAPDYPPSNRGEDCTFLEKWPAIRVMDNPASLYVRIYHGHNVLHRDDIMCGATRDSHILCQHQALVASILKRYSQVLNTKGNQNVG